MAYFEDDRELIKALQDKVKSFVSPYVYQGLAYDEADLEDLWTMLRSGKEAELRGKFTKKSRKSGSCSEAHIPNIMKFRHWGEFKVRRSMPVLQAFGLTKPIPFNELFEHKDIIDFPRERPSRNKQGTIGLLSFPINDLIAGTSDRVHIWEGYPVRIPDVIIDVGEEGNERRLSYHMHDVSDLLNCTPGLAIAWLLTDLPVHNHLIDAVISHVYSKITLSIREYEVSMQLVRIIYSIARYFCRVQHDSFRAELSKRKIDTPKVIRPRGVKKKTKELMEFIESNHNLTWRELWELWNTTYPNLRYKSINSMRTVAYRYGGTLEYYKALKYFKLRRGKK